MYNFFLNITEKAATREEATEKTTDLHVNKYLTISNILVKKI